MYSEAGFYAGGILSIISFIWVAYEVWTQNFRLTKTAKFVWTIAAFFFSVITAIVYFFIEKRKTSVV